MSSNQERDYYKFLFTPESDSDIESDKNLSSPDSLEDLNEYDPNSDFLEQGNFILRHFFNLDNIEKNTEKTHESTVYNTDSDMDLDSDCTDSSINSWDSDNSDLDFENCSSDTMSIPDMADLLQEDDILDLLGQKDFVEPKIPKASTAPPLTADKLGTFNIQNKFDHDTAAELFIREDMTFLALQEPFAHSKMQNDSWDSYQKLELQNARITSYFTNYQVIMFDSWKWGGKILLEFESFAYGRVTSIAFDLGNNQLLGIISVYASTVEATASGSDSMQNDEEQLNSTAELISKVKERFSFKYPDMCIVVMGDIQETLTTEDVDNMGKTRYKTPENGILRLLENSHQSIVRETNKDIAYITRIGKEGGRGIDHIMIPICDKFSNWFVKANICRNIGSSYFPSDHSLLLCHLNRTGPNNMEDGEDSQKYDYNKIFRIKLAQKGENKDELCLDENQFKDCAKYREQKELYEKIQGLTGNDSDTTDYLLGDIEKRTNQLFKKLWYEGLIQNVNGKENKLVEISDNHAIEIAHIVTRFNAAVKDIMQSLSLVKDTSQNSTAGITRGRLRKRKGFKFFDNLPIPTKLRYLRNSIKRKSRSIKQALMWLEERELRKRTQNENLPWSEFIQILIQIKKGQNIQQQSKTLYEDVMLEAADRENHVEAINHMNSNKFTKIKISNKSKQHQYASNHLPFVPDIIVTKINSWLKEAKCDHLFGAIHSNDTFKNILDCSSSWMKCVEQINIEQENMESEEFQTNAKNLLQQSFINISRISSKISSLQRTYKQATLQYFLDSNQISNFTRKMLPQGRSAPATHSQIWDPSLDAFRNCKNEQEELVATKDFHGKWMGNSASAEVCAFAKVKTVGKLGQRGVILMPERVVTNKDINNLVHNGHKLSPKVKKAFIKAHGAHVSRLFNPPKQDHSELFYPFYLKDNKGGVNEEEKLERSFWKSISSVPTKARHDGFQLAVIGRMGARWQLQLLKIIKLILVMRYVPESLKKIARFPIPKPGKINEYRPISLCNDLYCFLNGIITKYSSEGIERARILHEGIVAYRRGRGCHSLVTIEQCFREDCVSGPWPAVQLDEDEEKFFDRVPVEIILAAMRVNGFPEQGFLEFKASAMGPKLVEIITNKGRAFARFICGLEQGNPDSPTIANLVIKFKHDVWETVTNEIKKIFQKQKGHTNEKYIFNIIDPVDGLVMLCRIGYCDDNSKYIRVEDEKDLVRLVEYYLQLAGDLSMVTKIGRKSSKCDIQFYNISADMTIKLKKCTSIAWSFKSDGPIEEEVPFRVYLKKEEYEKLKQSINYDNLATKEKESWDKIINSEAHRHLGMTGTLSGSTLETSKQFLSKMENRLHQLNIRAMDIQPQRKCINMLINTIHSYVPLQANHSGKTLAKFDDTLADVIRRKNGITASDCKHRIFLPIEKGGLGISSALEIDVIAVAREMEIVSNSISLDSFAFRTRIADAKCNRILNKEKMFFNHAQQAIDKLGRYGIHVRDRSDGMVNDILNHFSTLKRYATIGQPSYYNGDGHSIGMGKANNLMLAFGGPVHNCALTLQQNQWKINEQIQGKDKDSLIKFEDMLKILPTLKRIKMHDFNRLFSFWEWINEATIPVYVVPNINNKWISKIPIEFREEIILSTVDWERADESLLHLAQKNMQVCAATDLSFNPTTEKVEVHPDNIFERQLNLLLRSKSPIIVATDGALKSSNLIHSNVSSSALVICMLDIKANESIDSEEWTHRPVIPIISRCSMLPGKIGQEETDIASAECHALLMTELTLPSFLPRIFLTDSEAVRDQVIHARENIDGEINRTFIRSNIGGIGKCIMGILATLIHQNTIEEKLQKAISQNPLVENVVETLKERNSKFLNVARTWTKTSPIPSMHSIEECENKVSPNQQPINWKKEYFDDNIYRSILKINSHQLDNEGINISDQQRYPALIPNLCVLNANHIADKIADLPTMEKFASSDLHNYKIRNPPSPLRFYITIDGQSVDKHISAALQSVFTQERIKKLKTKETQGLLWRLIEYTTASWEELSMQKGFFRSLLGLSRTHTRSIYKDINYKQGSLLEYTEALTSEEDRSHIRSMKKKAVTELLTKCSWCPKQCAHESQHGNRMHALLYCGHTNLKEFRTNLRHSLNEELCNLIRMIETYSNKEHTINFIQKISSTYLHLQRSQEGRLRKIHDNLNHTYASLNELKAKYNENDTLNCILSNTHLAAIELFGLVPQHVNGIESDANIGTIDCMWLGLVPRTIDIQVKSQRRVIRNNIDHLENKVDILENFEDKWKLIKGLILGLAAGIHKIINSTSKEMTSTLQKKHSLDAYTITAVKKRVKRTKAPSEPSIQNTSNSMCTVCQDNQLESIIQRPLTTKCSGITCSENKPNWFIFKNFKSNKIASGKKHCLRCTRHSSAIRAAKTTLENFSTSSSTVAKKKLIKTLCDTSLSNPSYFRFMQLLQEHLPTDKQRTKTKYTNKSRISDTHKTMCKTLAQVFKLETHVQQPIMIISNLADLLKSTLQNSEHNICENRKREREAGEKAKVMMEQIEISPMENEKEPVESRKTEEMKPTMVMNPSERKDREYYLKETLMENGLLSSMAIRRAIEVFRHRNNAHHYFANPEANSILESWESTQGWRRAARMFGCHRVICDKPNGIYFIPIFEGKAVAGYWVTAIIHKQGRHRRGYIMDSLGNANTHAPIFRKIQELFKSNSSSFAWTSIPCFPQVEVECGPRTIMHIAQVLEELDKGSSLDVCMEKAALLNANSYSALSIRESAANIIGRFKSEMWTNPVQIGGMQENCESRGTSSRPKRNKRRRRNRSANTSSCIVLSE